MPIDAGGWLNVTIDTGTIVSAIAIAYWQHRHAERRAHRTDLSDLRLLLAEGESISEQVGRYGPLTEQQLIRLGARDFAVRAARSALCGPERLRPALTRLAGVADELARSAGFASELRCAVVQDRTVRSLAAAIDRVWIDVGAYQGRTVALPRAYIAALAWRHDRSSLGVARSPAGDLRAHRGRGRRG